MFVRASLSGAARARVEANWTVDTDLLASLTELIDQVLRHQIAVHSKDHEVPEPFVKVRRPTHEGDAPHSKSEQISSFFGRTYRPEADTEQRADG